MSVVVCVASMRAPALADWQHFNVSEGRLPGVPHALIEDRSRQLWFAGESGVVAYDGYRWQSFIDRDAPAGPTWSLCEDRAGNIWCGGDRVHRHDGRGWTSYGPEAGLPPGPFYAVAQDSLGNLWFSSPGRVTRFDGNVAESFGPDGLPGGRIEQLVTGRSGTLWALSREAGQLARYDGALWSIVAVGDPLSPAIPTALALDQSGRLWVASQTEAYLELGGTWSTGLAIPCSDGILEDRQGRLWVGCLYSIYRHDRGEWRRIYALGPEGDSGIPVLQDRAGNLWFLGQQRITRYDGEEWQAFASELDIGTRQVTAMAVDPAGSIWFAGDGVHRLNGGTWSHFGEKDGLPSTAIADLILSSTLGS